MMKKQLLAIPLLVSGLNLVSGMAAAAEAKRADFGKLADGTPIEAVVLTNRSGVSARLITLGAALQALSVPDRDGAPADIVLGYATPAEYVANPQYFGVTVGRYANRIKGARFTLDGKAYALEANDGSNHLHGGSQGFDKVVWEIESVEAQPLARVVFHHLSPDGADGYPGDLDARAIYTLSDDNELGIEYRATTSKATIVNMTNHSFFNLAGEAGRSSVMGHRLTLYADRYTPVDGTLIPTGERRDVGGTPFDFRTPHAIGARIRDGGDEQIRFGRGYDHNYIINDADGTLRLAARVEDPQSGRVMELLSTAPGIQFYSGNFLDGTVVGKGRRAYRQGDALCLEPQFFPDSPNQPDFPSPRLDPGETYVNKIALRFPAPR
jgi:aldose 1-epimerase